MAVREGLKAGSGSACSLEKVLRGVPAVAFDPGDVTSFSGVRAFVVSLQQRPLFKL